MSTHDPYQTLGVSQDADAATIKRAYRRLVLRWHPDRNPSTPGAEAQFKQIHEAYLTLTDARRRPPVVSPPRPDAATWPFDGPTWAESARADTSQTAFDPEFDDEDPFSPVGDPRLEMHVAIPAVDAIRGVTLPIELNGVSFTIRVPPGVSEGTRVRVPASKVPAHSGPPCSLVLVIHFARMAAAGR